ncbi:MAG: protein-methionine-sulfoxide reductase catalytic subunit MsrP [Candidatus Hydrogenedentota bacterium]
MTAFHFPPSWKLPEHEVTPESMLVNRRSFLKTMGIGGLMIGTLPNCRAEVINENMPPLPAFTKNADFTDAGREITKQNLVQGYNNFYEFGFSKTDPIKNAQNFKLDPYALKIDGLCENPGDVDLDQIEKLGLEERVYRFRCVEAWSMTVPWVGVPLRKLIEQAKPTNDAKYVAFKCFYAPDIAIGQRDTRYRWPYFEGLRLDEAMNDLTLISTGYYGKRLLPQSGTPLRIITPWKYGYKGPKSIVQMTFTDKQPPTYWNTAIRDEYKFYSNVDPEVPHPRWSQAKEQYLGTSMKDKPTEFYNGYGEQVADMYKDKKRNLY